MKLGLSLVLVACFVAGCVEKEIEFPTYAELKISGRLDEKVVKAVAEGATDIVVWENSDLNSVRLRYSFHGNRPFVPPRMAPVAPALLDDALAIFPLLEEKGISEVLYRCNKRVVRPDVESDTSFNFYELEFVGGNGDEMFYWNTRNKVEYRKFCSA